MYCPICRKTHLVSSEVECVVRTLYVVASVEILDIYALVGSLDSFDYRHVTKVQGTPVEGVNGITAYGFTIDASVIPREKVWQLQLKLSSSAQGITTVYVGELNVKVEKASGGASTAGLDRTLSASGVLGVSNGAGLGKSNTQVEVSTSMHLLDDQGLLIISSILLAANFSPGPSRLHA